MGEVELVVGYMEVCEKVERERGPKSGAGVVVREIFGSKCVNEVTAERVLEPQGRCRGVMVGCDGCCRRVL